MAGSPSRLMAGEGYDCFVCRDVCRGWGFAKMLGRAATFEIGFEVVSNREESACFSATVSTFFRRAVVFEVSLGVGNGEEPVCFSALLSAFFRFGTFRSGLSTASS